MPATKSRPSEAALIDFFVGNWKLAGQVLPGRFGPGGPTQGTSIYQWELDRVWEDPDTLVFTSTYPAPNQARVIYRKLPGDAILMQPEQATLSGEFQTYFETTLTRC